MALRKIRAWTQEELGERLGVSSQTIAGWESGRRRFNIAKMQRLCEVFGITPEQLFQDATWTRYELRLNEARDLEMQALDEVRDKLYGMRSNNHQDTPSQHHVGS